MQNNLNAHHIGIATKDIEKSLEDFKKTHTITYQSEIIYDPLQEVDLIYIETTHGFNVEFVCGKQVENLLEKGISYYHVCYEVDDLEKNIASFVQSGAFLVSPPKPAVLFNMRKVAFLYTTYGLVELLEKE